MMRRTGLFILAAAACAGLSHGLSRTDAHIHQAASFYHQERFDSALARLESMKAAGPWKRRDSLAYRQYSGMAAARLGRDAEAVAHFSGLLAMDSLFQFPRNEHPLVLENFARAKTARPNPPSDPTTPPLAGSNGDAVGDASVRSPEPVAPPREGGFSFLDSGASARTDMNSPSTHARPARIGLAYGAWPAGAGWLARGRRGHGLALGLLQAGGLGLSLYASHRISREEGDRFAIQDSRELESVERWQLAQRFSLSTALGAYLFSLIASAGD